MYSYKLSLNTKVKYVGGLGLLGLVILACAVSVFGRNDDFELAREEVLLRKIGHEILLHAGDSSSRVLPVKKITADHYQVQFEKEFSFQTDSLVKIVSEALKNDKRSSDYIVSVFNCSGGDVFFGYAISQKAQNNIVPCSGRKQPKGCYLIDIAFQNAGVSTLQKSYWVGGLSLFAFIGLLVAVPFRIRKNRSAPDKTVAPETTPFQIGNTLFDSAKMELTASGVTTVLTPKENKLFRIFAAAPGAVIERSRIQKEIWEDEGVIVGRSLDVFISRLRKKLENDPSIRLVNIHGKGYKLETDAYSRQA